MILVGDIGGTKALLAVQDASRTRGPSVRLPSGAYPTFEGLYEAFCEQTGSKPTAAVLAVAGPISPDGREARITQLPWVMDTHAIAARYGLTRVVLINDFHAQALAALALGENDLAPLLPGEATPRGAKAVLGAGTGLGQTFLVHGISRYEVVPSEGGHSDFAPTTERQVGLWRWLSARHGAHVSYERVLCGAGLSACYQFLRDQSQDRELASTRDAMATTDPAAVVTANAATDPLCGEALELFCEVYGQEAGNLALKVLANGGVYLCGGIAPRILSALRAGAFERGFRNKGRLTHALAHIPVWVVTNTESGLIGAGVAATRLGED